MDQYGFRRAPAVAQDDDYFSVNKGDDFERAPLSEHDYITTTVKRENFLALFLHEYDADVFVATHLYGILNTLGEDLPPDELNDLMNTSAGALGQSFVQKVRRMEK